MANTFMVDTFVTLGGFTFLAHEVPSNIPFGGKQRVKVHDVLGSNRTVDALGPTPPDLSWTGRFRGPSAIDHALQIDAMRVAGAEVELTWFGFYYTVVIEEFTPGTNRQNEIPYSIKCTVVDDPAQDGSSGGSSGGSLGGLVGNDLATAITTAIGATTDVVSAISNIGAAVAAVPQLGGSSALVLAPIALAANAAVNTITADMAANDPFLDAVSPDGVDPAVMATWLAQTGSASVAQSGLADTLGYVSRIGTNIALGAF